ncbi:MAG: DUF2802 domain-containing protein [Gammaproteobacteria bacterium]|nr:DUF2802 domain-containing protein [Gammaproteobacteria bacterium]
MTTNLLLLSNAALLAAAAIALVRFRHQARRFEKFWDSPTGVSLADAQSLNAKSSHEQLPENVDPQLEKRVRELQTAVRDLAKKGQMIGEPVDKNRPIENAVRMARHGASIDELIRSCGLNIGEAQLMRKLHGKTQIAARG